MRVLITGGRDWKDYWTINDAILDACSWQEKIGLLGDDFDPGSVVIIHGNARGADTLAGEVANVHRMRTEVYPARWDIYGRGAGPIRNQEMIDSGADICLAFLMPDSVGTADCIKRAWKANIPVTIYYHNGEIDHFE